MEIHPSLNPWFGAIRERLMGTVKNGLRKVLDKAFVTFDELYTIILQLESTINDRPLTYVNSDIKSIP